MAPTTYQPVIVVGASLVGVSAALCLASHQVPTIVLEKHSGKSQHPRAIGFTSRTMEIYRTLGIPNKHPAPEDFTLERAHVESLTGKWHDNSLWSDTERKPKVNKPLEQSPTPAGPKKEYSVERASAIPQDKLEPLLEALALERGADIRRKQTLIHVNQDQEGVIATIVDAEGNEQKIHGSYLIAADGNRSTVRELLQIPRHGRGHMQTLSSVLFRAPIEQWTKGLAQFDINQPDLKAFLASYSDGRWALMFKDAIDRDEVALQAAIYQAVGRSDFPIEIITTGRWELTALVADTFQSGRIFLAGDAAHTLPPNRGGYGANTGIHDVHNLAWKLAAVLSGKSSPGLLDTYDAERRPVALLRHDQIFVRADYKVHLDTATPAGEKIDDDAMEFGQIYLSEGIIGADESLPRAKKPDEWNGQPGTQIPHFWVVKGGKKIPSLDLFDLSAWTLIAESDRWSEAVSAVNEGSSVPLEFVHLGKTVQLVHGDDFQKHFTVSPSGAAIIRPDGYIAWRVEEIPSDAAETLKRVISKISFSASGPQI
ncbi:Tetracenomycin polyketide synthesis hydroxylase TcmG [Penicillium rolfsii]|nr:Tetracenomycin polyketide synthesis hydroxylase TcmG [Penicillium rolfsii]